jgi:DNA-directed RNA polymerase specialized sigma24 family protein
MDSRQIEAYVKSHADMVKKAVASMPIRLTREEREDASQELYITMIHCLRNYNPARRTPIENYVGVSLYRRAQGLAREHFNGAKGRENSASSLNANVYFDGASEQVQNTIEDGSTPFDLYVDAKLLSDDILSQLEPFTRSVIVAWSENMSIWAISKEYGYSLKWIYSTLERGLVQLKEIVNNSDKE